jgi:hypothetical protein
MSVGADKAYDTRDFVQTVREMGIRPHVARNSQRAGGSAIDGRTSRHETYAVSQGKRPLIEKAFGWMKQTGGVRRPELRGLARVPWQFPMTAAAFNLWRLPKLQTPNYSRTPKTGVFQRRMPVLQGQPPQRPPSEPADTRGHEA